MKMIIVISLHNIYRDTMIIMHCILIDCSHGIISDTQVILAWFRSTNQTADRLTTSPTNHIIKTHPSVTLLLKIDRVTPSQ